MLEIKGAIEIVDIREKDAAPEKPTEYEVRKVSENWGYATVPFGQWRRVGDVSNKAGGNGERPHIIPLTTGAESVIEMDKAFLAMEQIPPSRNQVGEVWDHTGKKWISAYRFIHLDDDDIKKLASSLDSMVKGNQQIADNRVADRKKRGGRS